MPLEILEEVEEMREPFRREPFDPEKWNPFAPWRNVHPDWAYMPLSQKLWMYEDYHWRKRHGYLPRKG